MRVGDRTLRLRLRYQDDQSTPDVASRLVDQMQGEGIGLLLGPYGSASTEAAAAVVERNGQVMVEGSGADDQIFTRGYRTIFAVLSPASQYLTSIVRAVSGLANPKPATVAIVSADDGFSKTAAEAGKAEGLAPAVADHLFLLLPELAARGYRHPLVEQDVEAALSVAARGYLLELAVVTREGGGTELLADPRLQTPISGCCLGVRRAELSLDLKSTRGLIVLPDTRRPAGSPPPPQEDQDPWLCS